MKTNSNQHIYLFTIADQSDITELRKRPNYLLLDYTNRNFEATVRMFSSHLP
jgi:hypothetical protein